MEFADVTQGKIKLILTARRLERLNSFKSQLSSQYPDIKIHTEFLDVSKINTIREFFSHIPEEFKDIDVLVNNAGLALGKEQVGEMKQEDIDTVFNTNVMGNIEVVQNIVPFFKRKNSGDIVQLGSVAGREPYVGGSVYCASKFAIRAFNTSLRQELMNTKIRVIEVQPGAVDTEFSTVRFKGDKKQADATYVAEPLYAEDIADTIVYAVSRRQNVVIAESLIFPNNQAGGGSLRWEDPEWTGKK